MSHPVISVDILDALLSARGHLGAEQIAERLGVPTRAVHGEVRRLQDYGCEIESHPGVGYRIREVGLGCWSDYIEQRHAGRIGHKTVVYGSTSSTQSIARRLVEDSSSPGSWANTVILTNHQSSGHGRLGARWEAPAGEALLMTGIVRDDQTRSLNHYTLAVVIALAEAVETVTALKPSIKWPNDLLLEGKKLAGILIERVSDMLLLGVGINTGVTRDYPEPLQARIVGLADMDAGVDRLLLLGEFLNRLHEKIMTTDREALIQAWRSRSAMLESMVEIEHDGQRYSGRVVDVDVDEGLSVALERGQKRTFPAANTRVVKFGVIED